MGLAISGLAPLRPALGAAGRCKLRPVELKFPSILTIYLICRVSVLAQLSSCVGSEARRGSGTLELCLGQPEAARCGVMQAPTQEKKLGAES
jgi:hypothetical protein